MKIPYETSLFPMIGFGPSLHSLGGGRMPEPSVRYQIWVIPGWLI